MKGIRWWRIDWPRAIGDQILDASKWNLAFRLEARDPFDGVLNTLREMKDPGHGDSIGGLNAGISSGTIRRANLLDLGTTKSP